MWAYCHRPSRTKVTKGHCSRAGKSRDTRHVAKGGHDGQAAIAGRIAMKGDRVEVVVDAGDTTRSYEITASKAGRRVEVSIGRGVVEVVEVTRAGTPVRTARFMASRVVALVEHPAPARILPEERTEKPSARDPTASPGGRYAPE